MDNVDLKIINILKQDSRLTNKEIGEKIHMTGQAVGHRIKQLMEHGEISQFTIKQNHEFTQFIRIFLNGSFYQHIENLVKEYEEIEEFHKVSGQACYIIKSHFSKSNLNQFIEELSKYARYTVENVM